MRVTAQQHLQAGGADATGAAATLSDVSHLQRLGFKGPRAAQLLSELGIALPPMPNSWLPLADSAAVGLVARLGGSEFFIEQATAGGVIARVQQAFGSELAGVYPVLREDSAFVLGGERVHDVLAEVCNVNFAAQPDDTIVMTSMTGVGVLVVPQQADGGRRYRIWCDPTFGAYLWNTLRGVVGDCSGSDLK